MSLASIPEPAPDSQMLDASSRRDLLRALAGLGAVGFGSALAGCQQASTATASASGSATDLVVPPATEAVTGFRVAIPERAIEALRARLATTRWPEKETVNDWSEGVPLAQMRALTQYWLSAYDMRRLEQRLNAVSQYRTELDGLGFHFLHVKSQHANALPIILTHGWPGSVVEFLKLVGPLTDPTAHGGRAEDAFHVVAPSLPGYGFSDKPSERGWSLPRIARAWATLMQRLGYADYVAQGGDWGAGVTTWMAKQHVQGLKAIHLNLPILFPPPIQGRPSAEEQTALTRLIAFGDSGAGYAKLQSTRPQTIGYALADSPVGQAAWIYEKLSQWSDPNDDDHALSRDEILDNIMLYWLTDTGASSARLYFESYATHFTRQQLDMPVGVSVFPGELYRPLRVWGERTYSQIYYWNEVARGGHFAAFEQPEIFVGELRRAFAQWR
jgi:pimeloyl-ACP methyl ester carboxylesterase